MFSGENSKNAFIRSAKILKCIKPSKIHGPDSIAHTILDYIIIIIII